MTLQHRIAATAGSHCASCFNENYLIIFSVSPKFDRGFMIEFGMS